MIKNRYPGVDIKLYIAALHIKKKPWFRKLHATYLKFDGVRSKIEKVPRGIRGEKSSKDMASSRNLVSTIGALASPKMGDGTRCPEG